MVKEVGFDGSNFIGTVMVVIFVLLLIFGSSKLGKLTSASLDS